MVRPNDPPHPAHQPIRLPGASGPLLRKVHPCVR
jgi:hypothetical protein